MTRNALNQNASLGGAEQMQRSAPESFQAYQILDFDPLQNNKHRTHASTDLKISSIVSIAFGNVGILVTHTPWN